MSNGDNGKRFSERFISFDYAEMKDLLKAFVTLATTVLAFSVTFSEKIVNFQAADLPPKLVLLASWVLLVISVILCGIALCLGFSAAAKATHEKIMCPTLRDLGGFGLLHFYVVLCRISFRIRADSSHR